MLVSCTYEVHPIELVERQGKFYEINSTTPFTGSSAMYYDTGQLYERKNYKGGKLEGLLETYYDNGLLMKSNNYKNGLREDGPEYTYMGSGKIWFEKNYKNGKQHGLKLQYMNTSDGHVLKYISCWAKGVSIASRLSNTSECKVD